MTLTEFLLARIAEDEEWAMTSASTSTPGAFARDNYGALLIQPTRVMAECESKRRIVEECRLCDLDDFKPGTETWGYREALRGSVQSLASVYSDHPDYNEDWRP